jgi:WD40 repeat protein
MSRKPGAWRRGRAAVLLVAAAVGLTNAWGLGAVSRAQRILQLRHPDELSQVGFSPDGETIVTMVAEGTVRFWAARTGRLRRIVRLERDDTIDISPDWRTLASQTQMDHGILVRFWEVPTGRLKRRLLIPIQTAQIFISPDLKHLSTIDRPPNPVHIERSVIRLWDLATGKLERRWVAPGSVASVVISPDGKSLATIGFDDTVALWDLQTGALKRTMEYTRLVMTVRLAFSPDWKLLASAREGGSVKLRDLQSGRVTRTLPGRLGSGTIAFIQFSPDGRTLALGQEGDPDSILQFWDLQTGLLKQTVTVPDSPWVLSPDGRTLATVSGDAQVVRLWRIPSPPGGLRPGKRTGHAGGSGAGRSVGG